MLSIPAAGAGAQEAKAPVSLRWAFIRMAQDGQGRVIDFSSPPTVSAGDRVQVYLQPLGRIHLYLYLFDSRRDLALLYPTAPRASPASAGEGIFLPAEGQWFTIDDHPGEEQFYLVASASRLARLEDLTAAWLKAPTDAEARARVLAEIKELRRSRSSLAGAVEKAVPIAGTFQTRSISQEILGEATVVESAGFYARTLRMEHE